MATFALVHGSGDGGWAWHRVQRVLQARGHVSVAPDLPTDREDATWDDCADAVVRALDAVPVTGGVVVVGHSAGSMVVPLVAARTSAVLQVHVAGLVPRAGETPIDWFDAVGWAGAVADAARQDGGLTGHADPMVVYYPDVPRVLARLAMARERPTSSALAETPWPGPDASRVPARYVVTALDRFVPPAVQRRVAAERLGISDPDVVRSGHCAALAAPDALTAVLDRAVRELV
ncbi:alpha/beta fold hydrolase [Aeromicrobium sp. IC_218]|uniref:alpha/beta fold hydrolase n=1 Tax=Aeromicrobium sp. IC_218 TaxID=2545468 RepID=UPI00103C8891|nr:alpha/beta fold hydrolase [Aeromicrobium sp. IC_218]TCI97406.1 alpha/beta hydrolase [Aeromicrobium sp. IC_218]